MPRTKTPAAKKAATGYDPNVPVTPCHLLMKLCIGDRCYGRAATEAEAIRNASKVAGHRLKAYNLYLVHPDAWVDGMGAISFPSAFARPILYKVVRGGAEVAITEDL